LCDAWFDVVLDARTAGFIGSLLSALFIEVPIAVLCVLVARRLLRMTISQVIKYEGGKGPVPSLWKVPLFGTEDGTPLDRLIKAAKSDGHPDENDTSAGIWPESAPEKTDPPPAEVEAEDRRAR
jgi:hypothetical protein